MRGVRGGSTLTSGVRDAARSIGLAQRPGGVPGGAVAVLDGQVGAQLLGQLAVGAGEAPGHRVRAVGAGGGDSARAVGTVVAGDHRLGHVDAGEAGQREQEVLGLGPGEREQGVRIDPGP